MKMFNKGRIFSLLLMLCVVKGAYSHARLIEPPSRSSMWRFGFQTPKNYDDDGLYCGGMDVQWKKNGGKCGVCGDPWHIKPPRPNEIGGKYGQGIVVRSYKAGQVIQATIDVTANHRGYFEFRVCPSKNDKKEVLQECLDKYVLKIVNSSNTKYFVEDHGNSRVTLALQLPKSLICKRCVFQWTYTAGNNWGKCKNDTYGLGCGSQETFKACSDIAIGNSFVASTPSPNVSTTTTRYQRPPNNKNQFTTPRPLVTRILTFDQAIEKIRKNPKLKWMLQPKKQG